MTRSRQPPSSLQLPQPAAALAERMGGRLAGAGAGGKAIAAVKALHDAGPDDLSFCEGAAFAAALDSSQAGVVVVPSALAIGGDRARIEVDGSPRAAIASLLEDLGVGARPAAGVHPSATVDPAAQVAPDASVGPGAVIEADAVVGPGAVMRAHAVLGARCELGARSELAEGAVVGSQGFGFAGSGRQRRRFPHAGRVLIGADAEIGANSCVDRGALGDTEIGDRTRIDNLVQVGHNVRIGSDCVICGCVAIAGSAVLGNGCVIGGASSITGHIELADGVHVMGMSAVLKSISTPGAVVGGPLPTMEQGELHALWRWVKRLGRKREES